MVTTQASSQKFVHTQNSCVQNRSCVEIGKFSVEATQICVIFYTSFCVMNGFSMQSLSFCNTKISTQARFQHKSHLEYKSFKSVWFQHEIPSPIPITKILRVYKVTCT
jgi:hypothetical protein